MVSRMQFAAILFSTVESAQLRTSSTASANPIRKVVTLLQSMQAKVTEEGEKEAALYKKFMCYCQSSGDTLKESMAAAEDKITALEAQLKAAEEKSAALKQAIEKAQSDRAAAKSALADAAAMREKEAAEFASMKGEADANVAALNKAIAALSKGMGGFLQSSAAVSLRKLLQKDIAGMYDTDRNTLVAFLDGSQSTAYAPASGEILGILKQLSETMAAGLADAEGAEKAAVEAYTALVAAKKKEIETLTATIEDKMTAQGDAAVAAVQMKNDLADTKEDLEADLGFAADLAKGCDKKKGEWEAIVKTRSEELLAIADTIKVLNDDDALELFKKTLPGASSFVQMEATASTLRTRALEDIRVAQVHSHQRKQDRPQLDLIALALRGKKAGFGKVLEMIDGMVKTLEKDQLDDDHKAEYCNSQFSAADKRGKDIARAASAAEASQATTEEALATVTQQIAALEAGIKGLDKSVAEATAQRKAEHAEFQDVMSSSAAAKELLGFAKNRLNKFYAPKLFKPAPKTELSAEDRIFVSEGGTPPPTAPAGGIAGTGISAFAQLSKAAPPPPPETFGPYTKKSGENTGVIAMMDLLIKDLQKEMTESAAEEKDAQADYEEMMKHSSEKRAADSKSITDKATAKADLQDNLASHKEAGANAKAELAATAQFVADLHAECDWLLKYAAARKTARDNEISNLKDAHAVLSGADYSL